MSSAGEHHAEIRIGSWIIGAQLDGPFELSNCLFDQTLASQRLAEIIAGLRILWILHQRFTIMRNRLIELSGLYQSNTQAVVCSRFCRDQFQRLLPFQRSSLVLVLLHCLVRKIHVEGILSRWRVDLHHSVRRDIHKFRDVDRSVGRRRVFDQDTWAVVARLV